MAEGEILEATCKMKKASLTPELRDPLLFLQAPIRLHWEGTKFWHFRNRDVENIVESTP